MGKRGNENAQMRKEDYDQLEDDDGGAEPVGGFARASQEELAKRRIIRRVRKPAVSATPSGGGFGGGGGGGGSSGGGIFANINFGAPAPVAPAPASAPRKPTFAMPSTQPAISFSPAASSTPATMASSAPSNSNLESDKLLKAFQSFLQDGGVRKDYELTMRRFVTTVIQEVTTKENTSAASNAPAPVARTSSAPSSTPATGSLFNPSPAPLAFNFGSTASSSPAAAAPANKLTFSFGATSTAAPSPAASSGFNFNPTPSSAVPPPGSNIKIAFSPVPGPNATGAANEDDDDAPLQDSEPSVLEAGGADDAWTQLLTVKLRAYHYRRDDKPTKFASGSLRLQQSKDNSKTHRMIMRDMASGKVLLNVGVSKGMNFIRNNQKAPPGKRATVAITFVGVMEADRGAEKFTFSVPAGDDADKFHNKLTELSS